MSIWMHLNSAASPVEEQVAAETCLYCGLAAGPMHAVYRYVVFGQLKGEFKICLACGWWCKNRRSSRIRHEERFFSMWGTCGELKHLDLTNIETPIQEVKQYLRVQPAARFDLHPRRLEELVAQVFRDFGWAVEVTAYQNDGGIDAFLQDGSGRRIGVQVKRYQNTIEVEQIRALVGALVLQGLTRGSFVATSTFSRAATRAAAAYSARGFPVELLDGQRLLQALQVGIADWYPDLEKDPEGWLADIHELEDFTIYKDEGPCSV